MISQDQFRAAIAEVAADIVGETLPPLSLSSAQEAGNDGSAGRRRAGRLGPVLRAGQNWRWLTPLAAAAAVIAIVVASVAIAGGGARSPVPPPAPFEGLRSVPRYYLLQTPNGGPVTSPSNGSQPLYDAVIRDTLTGAVLATVRPPAPYHTFTVASAAADDQTFVLAAQQRPDTGADPTRFFRARFNPATGVVTLAPLPIVLPITARLTGMALSPDGASLAVSAAIRGGRAQIRLYSMATGAVRIWQGAGSVGRNESTYESISWARGGILAVNWTGANASARVVRLLDTATAGGSFDGSSRLAATSLTADGRFASSYEFSGDGIITPDGSTIIVPMSRFVGDALWTPKAYRRFVKSVPVWAKFGAYSAATAGSSRFPACRSGQGSHTRRIQARSSNQCMPRREPAAAMRERLGPVS